jgi:1-acyl-sn-glycerol-3-phosphate acyltransferase
MESAMKAYTTPTIDIREIFHKKNPRVAKFIPGFIYTFLRKILHLDEVNDFLKRHGEKRGLDFVAAAVKDHNAETILAGEENLPLSGRYIFVANHPLGGFDGLLLFHLIGKRFPHIKSISNDILLNLKNLADLFLPVNKHGKQSVEIVKNIDEVFNSDCQIITFPAGLVSRRRKGEIKDIEWKKSFIIKAIKHRRDVVPIHIKGRCTGLFYNIANIRAFLGIKTNIEMFLLSDETFRHKNKSVLITIAKPISWKTFDSRFSPNDWAFQVREFVYTLPTNHNRDFEDFIAEKG